MSREGVWVDRKLEGVAVVGEDGCVLVEGVGDAGRVQKKYSTFFRLL